MTEIPPRGRLNLPNSERVAWCSRAHTQDRIATAIICTLSASAPLVLIVLGGYIVSHGWAAIDLTFLTSPSSNIHAGGGIAPQIFDSFYLLILSMMITAPVALGSAIYVTQYSRDEHLNSAIRLASETLASLPSIVAGLFGLMVFVTMTGGGYSIFAGAMTLSVLNLPVAFRVAEEAIISVPKELSEASLSLGASKWQTAMRVVIPAALPGILTGLIMTAGRIFGEAAALLYTAGMSAPPLDWKDMNPTHFRSPLNPFRPAETLAVHIWRTNSESVIPDVRRVADGSALVLLVIVFASNVLAKVVGRKLQEKTGRRS